MRLTELNTVIVVYNPNSGNAPFLHQTEITQRLEALNMQPEWMTLDALKTLAEKTKTHHQLLIVGGDGTLHMIINTIGLQHLYRFTFGIIPTGTGNDFARSLNIPLDINKAFETLSDGDISPVDLGVINHRTCFTCAMSLGFGTEVTKCATRPLKVLLGRWALYLGAFIYLLKPKTAYKLRTKLDRQPEITIRTSHLVIGNAKTHGGGFPISPQADLQNALLDMYFVKPLGLKHLPRLYYKIFRRVDHTLLQEVTHRQVREVSLILPHPLDIDVDGDIYRFYRRMHVKIHPGALNVITPKTDALQDNPIYYAPRQFVSRKRRAG